MDPTVDVGLISKLHEVAQTIDRIAKRGENQAQHYNYVKAEDVVDAVRKELLARRVQLTASTIPGSVQHFADTGGKSFVTTIDLAYRFTDVDSGETIELTWTGAGADIGGDKGLYKAMTGALKYVLLTTFLIPTGDDPETDRTTETANVASRGDERPAAPRIPLDRAQAILGAAINAGLANMGDGEQFEVVMTPVLRAKLATLGVERIGLLNVDQAEDVEAFIKVEAQAAGVMEGQ